MRSFLFLALLFVTTSGYSAQNTYNFSDADRTRYENKIEAELNKSGEKVPKLLKDYQKDGDIDLTIRVRVDHAAAMHEVKATLVGNLIGSDVLRSPKVREELLDILEDDSISEEDLIELQNVINEERANILKADQEAANQEAEKSQEEG